MDNLKVQVKTEQFRAYTNALLELVNSGAIDQYELIFNLLGWIGELEVQEFVQYYYDDMLDNGD